MRLVFEYVMRKFFPKTADYESAVFQISDKTTVTHLGDLFNTFFLTDLSSDVF